VGGGVAGISGARGCVDLWLRRVGANGHGGPAVAQLPQPPEFVGVVAAGNLTATPLVTGIVGSHFSDQDC